MKRILSFTLALIMVLSVVCTMGFTVMAEDGAEMFWLTHYNDSSREGAGVVFTETYTGAAWWLHFAFAPVAGAEDAYEITAIANGLEDGSAKPLAVPEGGFVYAVNTGNNWPAINPDGSGINYTSANCTGAIARAKKWKVGDKFTFTGLDLEGKTIPTSTSGKDWYDPDYVCTATVAPYVPGEPIEEPEEPVNLALNKPYTHSELYGSPNPSWPDEGGVTLTDGKKPDTASYSNAAWAGFNVSSQDYKDNGYAWIRVDLEEVKSFNKASLSSCTSSQADVGISTIGSLEVLVSVDGTNFYSVGKVDAVDDPSKNYNDVAVSFKDVAARYVEFRFTKSNKNWMFIAEAEVFEGQAAVKAEVLDGSLEFDPTKLGALYDGEFAEDAAEFGDSRLYSFKNTGFDHTAGVAAAVEATVAITVDLGEIKHVNDVSAGFYLGTAYMIDLPTNLKYYISNDGVNFFSITVESAVTLPNPGTDNAINKITSAMKTRGTFDTRYIKIVATLKNGWFFMSEINVIEDDVAFSCKPQGPYEYKENEVPNPSIGVFDASFGTIDLAENTEGKYFKSSQITIAKYDPFVGAYEITSNAVNPYPGGHTGTVVLADDEILVAIQTNGAYGTDRSINNLTNVKWIARGLTVGDYIMLGEDGLYFFKPEQFAKELAFKASLGDVTPVKVDYLGCKYEDAGLVEIIAGDEKTVGELVAAGDPDATGGAQKDMQWWQVTVVNEFGIVTEVYNEVGDDKATFTKKAVECPEGGFIIMANHRVKTDLAVGQRIYLFNVDLDAIREDPTFKPGEGSYFVAVDHEHNFSEEVTIPATLKDGCILKFCECGMHEVVETLPAIPAQESQVFENLALGATETKGEYDNGGTYNTSLTDGVICASMSSAKGDWYAVHKSNSTDNVGVIDLEFEEPIEIANARIHFAWEGSWGITAPKAVKIEVSTDGDSYTEVASETYSITSTSAVTWFYYTFEKTEAKYVRISVTKNGTFAFLNEIELYGEKAPKETPAGAMPLTHAGLYFDGGVVALLPAKEETTISKLAELGDGEPSELAWWDVICCNEFGIVTDARFRGSYGDTNKGDMVVPAGGFAIVSHCNATTAAFKEIGVGQEITLYNVYCKEIAGIADSQKVSNACFTVKEHLHSFEQTVTTPATLAKTGEAEIKCATCGESFSRTLPVINAQGRPTIDGYVDDTAWKDDAWVEVDGENGYWQALPTTDDLSFKYQLKTDGEYLYVASVLNCPFVDGQTKIRIWINSDETATVYTHFYDVYTTGGELATLAKYNTSKTANSGAVIEGTTLEAAANTIDSNNTVFEFKVKLSEFGGEEGFTYYICAFNKVNESLCLFYPALEEGASRLDNLPYKVWDFENDAEVAVVSVPEGAIKIDRAGYEHANGHVQILAGNGETTIGALTALGCGAEKDLNYHYTYIINEHGSVIKALELLGREPAAGPNGIKTNEVVPAGCYVLAVGGSSGEYVCPLNPDNIKEGDIITLYNVDLEALRGTKDWQALTNAGFSVTPHTHEFKNPVTNLPKMNEEGSVITVCDCGTQHIETSPIVEVQPEQLETVPDGVIKLKYAGLYFDTASAVVLAGYSDKEVSLSELGVLAEDEAYGLAYWAAIICNAKGEVISVLPSGSSPIGSNMIPAGGFAVAIHCDNADASKLTAIKVGQIVTVHNVLLEKMRGVGGTARLTDAFITYADAPTALEIEVNVNEKEILTDGTKDVSGNWGSGAGEDNVLLIKNEQCKELPMNVTVKYDLGESKYIDSVSMFLYHCAGVMIGYPEGKAKVSVSTDGTTYTSVGEFDFAAAELASGKFGTVENKFAFDAVDARYIKVEFTAGSNEAVLGATPADNKIFWEFVSMTEFEVGEVEAEPIAKGDIDGDGAVDAFDYQMLKAYVLGSYTEATADQIARMDLNGDGSVDAFDYQMLKCVVLGTYQFD